MRELLVSERSSEREREEGGTKREQRTRKPAFGCVMERIAEQCPFKKDLVASWMGTGVVRAFVDPCEWKREGRGRSQSLGESLFLTVIAKQQNSNNNKQQATRRLDRMDWHGKQARVESNPCARGDAPFLPLGYWTCATSVLRACGFPKKSCGRKARKGSESGHCIRPIHAHPGDEQQEREREREGCCIQIGSSSSSGCCVRVLARSWGQLCSDCPGHMQPCVPCRQSDPMQPCNHAAQRSERGTRHTYTLHALRVRSPRRSVGAQIDKQSPFGRGLQ